MVIPYFLHGYKVKALMVNIFMTIYGKVGLRELAKQNLAKTNYAAQQFGKHAKVLFSGASRFNEFVVQTTEDPYAINSRAIADRNTGGSYRTGPVCTRCKASVAASARREGRVG